MSIVTLEGIVEDGQVRLHSNVRLPDSTKVYVIIPGLQVEPAAHLASPRLARLEQASEFTMEVIEESLDAALEAQPKTGYGEGNGRG